MRHYLLLLCLFLCLTIPLHAQDEPTPYEIALQRIQEASASGATELDLGGLGLTSLPPEIGQLTSLQYLFLNHNKLWELPPEIGQLTDLQLLSVYANRLRYLPSELGELSSLRSLQLSNNQLYYLPIELGNLTSLTSLNLSDNPLMSPPPEVVEQGTAAVLDYLRNQARYHIQRLIIGTASGVGLLAVLILGVRYRQVRRKPKAKRGLA